MKEKLSGITICAFTVALALSACGKGGSTAKSTQANMNAGVATVGGSESDNLSAFHLDHVVCENPIAIDDPAMTPVTQQSDFPKANFKLSVLQLYMIWESTNNSFAASASDSNHFTAKVDCNGVSNLQNDNFDRTYTDADGARHHDQSTHTERLSGDFKVAEGIDALSRIPAANQRMIEVKFRNGKVVLADSRLISAPSSESSSSGKKIVLDRMQVGADTYITYRIYLPSAKQIEIRAKIEMPADKDGKRVIEFGRAVYDQI